MENELSIFTAALELSPPWFVSKVEFITTDGAKVLHIRVEHEPGATFDDGGCPYPAYDHRPRTWRHLNFFQHTCHLHARVPRIKLPDGKVKQVAVPWASEGSAFTLLFQALVLNLLKENMSASAVGRHLGIGDKRVFRIVRGRVEQALGEQSLEPIKALSIDETSTRKGHRYFTVLCDRDAKKVVGLAKGKDKAALAQALAVMEGRGAGREAVTTVTMDMSAAYLVGTTTWMPEARIVFDRFHLVKKLHEAIDEIRRQEQKHCKELKHSRYLWLRKHRDLTGDQQHRIDYLQEAYPTIGAAYRLKELFREVFDQPAQEPASAIALLNEWMDQAWQTKSAPLQTFVNMLESHWYGVESFFQHRATNAFAERVNLKIQEIKRVAKGYTNSTNYMTMIYFHLGGLNLAFHIK